MRRLYLLLCPFIVLFCKGHGQSIPLYPDVYANYFFNMPSVSPAYIQPEGKGVFGGMYKFRVGETNLATYDMNAALMHSGERKNRQLYRLNFSNEKEGPYINTPRGNVNFAYQLSLSEALKLSTGLSFGFVSRNYSAPSSTGKGNVLLPDGNLGVELVHKHYRIGTTMSQFLNSSGEAIQSSVVLATFYQLYGQFTQQLSPMWSIQENLLIRVLPQVTNQLIAGLGLKYHDQVSFGVNYYQRRGAAFFVAAKLDKGDPLTISIGYNSSFLAQTPVWSNSIELGLNYTIL